VRDRLLQGNQEVLDGVNHSKDRKKNAFLNHYNGINNNHVGGASVDAMTNVGGVSLDKKHSSPPIADLFPDATVLFADLAGFTAWSSSRDPVQVFALLEVLYGAFDKIALRRGVFKIETIGDCYLAVCGLPEPRRHHATVMVSKITNAQRRVKNVKLRLSMRADPLPTPLCLTILNQMILVCVCVYPNRNIHTTKLFAASILLDSFCGRLSRGHELSYQGTRIDLGTRNGRVAIALWLE
jgi:Adenylate and Guanylate cyclase catalytic domain